jgi:hypothetical protein
MRRSTPFAPFSRLAIVAAFPALAAFGVISFAPPAQAADAKPASSKAAAAPADAAKGPDKKTRDAARKAYGEGEKAYASNDFAGAYSSFSKALELIPTPAAAYWVAKSLDQQGKTDEAIKAYEALLADPNVSRLGDEKTSDAQTRVATLKAGQVGEITVSSAALGAQLSVDGVLQPGPLPVVLKLAPGPHKLNITAPGFDAKEVNLEVKGGTKVEQKVDLAQHVAPPPEPVTPEVAPAPPPPPPPVEKHSKVPAYVTLGIATGGAIMGTIFGVKALQSKSDFDSQPTTKSADDTERNALIADMAFGVAVTLGVTGIVLLTSSDDTSSPAKAAKLHLPPKGTFRVTPYVGRESGGAAARLTF